MLSEGYPSCPVLSATLVYCGQNVGWIKMKFGMRARLGLGHMVLGGIPAPPTERGISVPLSKLTGAGMLVTA